MSCVPRSVTSRETGPRESDCMLCSTCLEVVWLAVVLPRTLAVTHVMRCRDTCVDICGPLGSQQHCATIGKAFASMARCIREGSSLVHALELASLGSSQRAIHGLRRVIVREETRRMSIVKAIAEAEDCLRYYGNVRKAWDEAGRRYMGMGESAPEITEQDMQSPAKAALRAYNTWYQWADLNHQAHATDTAMERLKFQLLQTVPFIPTGYLSPGQKTVLLASPSPQQSAGASMGARDEVGSLFVEMQRQALEIEEKRGRGPQGKAVEMTRSEGPAKVEPGSFAAITPSRETIFVELRSDDYGSKFHDQQPLPEEGDEELRGMLPAGSILSPNFPSSPREEPNDSDGSVPEVRDATMPLSVYFELTCRWMLP